MQTKAIMLIEFLLFCLLAKLLWPESLERLYFHYIDRKRSSAKMNWKKVRWERQRWDNDHPYAPKWHHERQELLRRELGLYMLFVDKGPKFSQAILDCRAKDLEKLAAQIYSEEDIFKNQEDPEGEE